MKRSTISPSLAVVAMAVPAPASAAWLQASSDHFVVYTDDSVGNVRTFSEQLERYHSAMAALTATDAAPPSPSNRVTVYIVRNEREVRKLYGEDNKYLGGFYVPRAGGSLAIVPRVHAASGELEWSMIALLHEYAHHFMISSSAYGMPRWYSEGGAEFFASARFNADGSMEMGRPAMHRAGELFFAKDVSAEDLLDPEVYERHRSKTYDAYYGKAWLLFHYLTFSKERSGQLTTYLKLIASGKPERAAALEAFGEFKTLEKELDTYLTSGRMTMLKLKPTAIKIGPVEVHELSAGEAAIMPVRIRSRRGVTEEQAKELLVDARAVAAKFPHDPGVLTALAEAEHDAGNDKEAIAAADEAIALDPGRTNAYVQKGLSMFRQADDAPDREVAFNNAVKPFVALNRIENDHPLPLFYFYDSFGKRGRTPSDLAYQGLVRALELAPFDTSLRMTLAMEQLHRHLMPDARNTLLPAAYDPHGGDVAKMAQRLVAKIDADPKWDGTAAELVMSAPVGADEGSMDAPDPGAVAGAPGNDGNGKPAGGEPPAKPAHP
jgi:Flp pilus assembly protein TadD